MYTIVEKKIRDILKECCAKLNIPCIPVLSRAIYDLSAYLNLQATPFPGRQHELDDNYFARVEAMNFAISHDDGQSSHDLDDADIVLVGVSRTSKSPTCVYLAHRGFKAANIPFVLNCPLPSKLINLTKPLVVGLTISPDRLMQIRHSRLQAINNKENSTYTDLELVKEELIQARKLCLKNNWPIIDVTRKSVEEVAATIIQFHQELKR
jgi:regulator of PEP synthase PpsR (kinase-PPPase family)